MKSKITFFQIGWLLRKIRFGSIQDVSEANALSWGRGGWGGGGWREELVHSGTGYGQPQLVKEIKQEQPAVPARSPKVFLAAEEPLFRNRNVRPWTEHGEIWTAPVCLPKTLAPSLRHGCRLL